MSAGKGVRGPVVAAIDLEEAADDVLTQAHAIAASVKARLVVCHVLHELLQARMLLPQLATVDAARYDEMEQRAREAIQRHAATVTGRSPRDFEVALETGSPHAGILRQAEQRRAGLVVVGPGAVASRVARYAPAAVLVARPSPRGGVLGATDFSDPSLAAIEMAAAEAHRRGTTLRLLHCVEFSEPVLLGSQRIAVGVLPALPAEVVEDLEREARERLRTALERVGASGECLVARGTAASAIVDAARQTPTELVVVGMRGRSNLSRMLLGTVADTLLRAAPCSVMVVHPAP